MIIRTDFIPARFDAFSAWPFIFVRPDDVNDKALIAHEMSHYESQAWQTPLWFLRYWLSKSFRLAAEVRAYKVSVEYGMMPSRAAIWLTGYRCNVTIDEALELLISK